MYFCDFILFSLRTNFKYRILDQGLIFLICCYLMTEVSNVLHAGTKRFAISHFKPWQMERPGKKGIRLFFCPFLWLLVGEDTVSISRLALISFSNFVNLHSQLAFNNNVGVSLLMCKRLSKDKGFTHFVLHLLQVCYLSYVLTGFLLIIQKFSILCSRHFSASGRHSPPIHWISMRYSKCKDTSPISGM